MINFNGNLMHEETVLTASNRGFLFGDGVFETCKVVDNKILFLEDHYFRLMSSMRILRMAIPMNFTLEYIEREILKLIGAFDKSDAFRVRITVYRNEGGYYLPNDTTISYLIKASPIENKEYIIDQNPYEIDIYKDFFISKQLLSTIKTTNKIISVTGSIFAKENDFQNCLLLNNEKSVIEALNGNLFILINNELITPPLSEGCLNGIMRKQIISLVKTIEGIELVERPIFSFELQKADELFITNVISGIQPVTKFRKKEYTQLFSEMLLQKLNSHIKI